MKPCFLILATELTDSSCVTDWSYPSYRSCMTWIHHDLAVSKLSENSIFDLDLIHGQENPVLINLITPK